MKVVYISSSQDCGETQNENTDLLPKPFTHTRLLDRVRHLLEG